MKKGVLIAAAVLLMGCSSGEAQQLTQPYNVETARTAQPTPDTPESPEFEVAEAVAEIPAEEPEEPEKVAEEPEVSCSKLRQVAVIETFEEPEPVIEYVEPVYEEPAEEMPTPADEFAFQGQTYIGTYTVTWYTREAVGYDAPGASGNGLVPYYSCAMPDYSLLNCTVLVEGYGYFHVDDISPAGIVDLYVASNADIPGYGMGAADVYIVG